MTARIAVRMTTELLVPAGSLATSPAMRADYEATTHRGEQGAEPCTYRAHDVDHPATIRLTPAPVLDPEVRFPHEDEVTVCRCCAYEGGHLYEEMRGEALHGDVGVALRQDDGEWWS